MLVQDEQGLYRTERPLSKAELLSFARSIAVQDAHGAVVTSPDAAKALVKDFTMGLEHEVFGVAWLNSKHVVSKIEILFRGSIDHTSVQPREVLKEAMYNNAAACVIFHNHASSGDPTPSLADEQITRTLIDTLAIVNVRLLDHIVIGHKDTVSLAETGVI